MVLVNDSLTVVLVGHWNKLYIQPDWMASNIFEKEELEIGVNGQGTDLSVAYRGDGVIISPSQSRMVFSVINTDDDTLNTLCGCLNRFMDKAVTPNLFAYGLNVDFVEEEEHCLQKFWILCRIQVQLWKVDMKLFLQMLIVH